MWEDSTVVYKKPVKFETVWVSKDNTFTTRYKGRKRSGDIWIDKSGVYHTITLNNTGEGASFDGPEQIEEFLARKAKFDQAFSLADVTVTEE